jgi:hypothetical protein
LEQVLKQGGAINMAVRGIKWPGRANLVVSLVSLHKGAWGGKCVLDGKVVGEISAYFEDSIDIGEPVSLRENFGQMFEGSKWTGDGFVITPGQAAQIVEDDPDSAEVVKLLINGDELNNHPLQEPPRRTVYFSDWPLSRAEQFVGAINWVVENVKAEREKHAEPALRKRWWLFKRPTTELYARLRELKWCYAFSRHTKHFGPQMQPTDVVFTEALKVLTTDRWDIYTVVQSTLHEVWARKYSGALKQDLRYSPSNCFETFPFPEDLWQTPNPALAELGERYHEHRRALMRQLWLGLTDIYNLFHTRDLTPRSPKVGRPRQQEAAG